MATDEEPTDGSPSPGRKSKLNARKDIDLLSKINIKALQGEIQKKRMLNVLNRAQLKKIADALNQQVQR